MARDYPWRLGVMKDKPVGLRECVLRIWYVTPKEVQKIRRDSRHTGMRNVAAWREDDPEKWQELLDLFGIDYTEDTWRTAPRRNMRKRVDLAELRATTNDGKGVTNVSV